MRSTMIKIQIFKLKIYVNTINLHKNKISCTTSPHGKITELDHLPLMSEQQLRIFLWCCKWPSNIMVDTNTWNSSP